MDYAKMIDHTLLKTDAQKKDLDKLLLEAKKLNPSNRNTHTIDIAKAVSMLMSEDSYWITGQTIQVDGGEGIINIFG